MYGNTVILSHVSHPCSDSATYIVKKVVLFESCMASVSL